MSTPGLSENPNYTIAKAICSLPEKATVTLTRRTLYGNNTIAKLYGPEAANQFMKWRQERPTGCTYHIDVKVKNCTPLDLENVSRLQHEQFKNRKLIDVAIVNKDGSIERLLASQREETTEDEFRTGILLKELDPAIKAIRAALNDATGDANKRIGSRTAKAESENGEWQHIEYAESACTNCSNTSKSEANEKIADGNEASDTEKTADDEPISRSKLLTRERREPAEHTFVVSDRVASWLCDCYGSCDESFHHSLLKDEDNEDQGTSLNSSFQDQNILHRSHRDPYKGMCNQCLQIIDTNEAALGDTGEEDDLEGLHYLGDNESVVSPQDNLWVCCCDECIQIGRANEAICGEADS